MTTTDNAIISMRWLVVAIVMSTLATTPVFGAEWSVGWTGPDGRFQLLTIADDKDYQFTMGRFLCKAAKVSLYTVNNEVFARRTVACQISKDTYASTDLSYNVNSKTCTETRSLTIYDKEEIHVVTLQAKCNQEIQEHH